MQRMERTAGSIGVERRRVEAVVETLAIAMTASGSVNAAVEAMRCGASDYLTKPFAMDELSTVLDRAAQSHMTDTATRQLRERLRLSQGLGAMIGRSGEMEKL